jgi:hypothetical protein
MYKVFEFKIHWFLISKYVKMITLKSQFNVLTLVRISIRLTEPQVITPFWGI